MQAWLMSKELWMLVDSKEPCPPSTDLEARLTWQKQAQKAAGELYLSVAQDQKSHIHGILTDPICIWSALHDIYMSKKPGARFHAYDELPSTTNEPETKTVTESAGNASVNHSSESGWIWLDLVGPIQNVWRRVKYCVEQV